MYPINGKLDIMAVFPLTKELRIFKTSSGYGIQWLNYIETLWEVKSINKSLVDNILQHTEEASKYQREPFHCNSTSHR